MKPVVKNRSCPAQVSRFRRCLLSAAIMAAGQALCIAPAWAGPEGGRVTGGDGTIDQGGRTTTINQNTDRLVVDWDSFNIDADETVNYIQPGTDSIALNRILSHRGSEIHGQINANGQVVLVNPHGMVFGEGAQVNVGGMIASGLRIASDDFMNGEFNFSALEGTEGAVINRGVIQAATGGSVSMLGRRVNNEGLISTNLGAVNLAAGKEAVVTFDDAGLMGVRVTKEVLQDELGVDPALVNSGELNAAGGRVLLTASTSRDIFSQAVNTGDVAQADSVVVHDDGSFTLGDGADVVNTGELNVSSDTEAAGQVTVLGENITHSGTVRSDTHEGDSGQVELHAKNTTLMTESGYISARSDSGQGGDIALLGHWVGLTDHASLNASGASGGGQILVGGDYRGQNTTIRNSQRTYVGADTRLQANALAEGDGGRIIIWADDITRYAGHLEARGAGVQGLGGFAEVSGKEVLNFRGTAGLSGPGGGGTLLLDPRDIKIVENFAAHEDYDENYLFAHSVESDVNFSSDDIAGLLNSGGDNTNIILEATRDISIEAEIRTGGTNTSSLTLRAGDDILLGENIPISLGSGDISFSAGVASCAPMDCYTGTEEGWVDLDGSSLSVDGRIDTSGTVVLRAADDVNLLKEIGRQDQPTAVSLRAGNQLAVSANITTDEVLEEDVGISGSTIKIFAGDPSLTDDDVPLKSPSLSDHGKHLIIGGELRSQGGDINLIAHDAVDINSDISTSGGNLFAGDEAGGYRPTSFDAQGHTLSTGTASQIGDSGRHAGEIMIRTEIRKDEDGGTVEYGAGDYSNTGNVELGWLDLDVNYEELDSPTAGEGKGALSVGSVSVVAEGDITLHNDWDFNNTGPYAFDGSGGEGLESASLDLTADGSVTLSGSIYDSYADARESLDITLTADTNNDGNGSVVVVGDVFTSGGNFTASGQNLTLPGRIDTHHANLLDGGSEQLGEGWSAGDPQGWSTGGDITLTASGNLTDGTMSLGTLQTIASCIEGAECTGNLTVHLNGPSASDVVTQRAGTSLLIAGATTLNLGSGTATLDHAANTLHGADGYVQVDSANDLTLAHAGSLVLDAVTMDGDLDVTTHGEDGSISGSKGLTVGGAADFNTQGNLTLLAPETGDPEVVNSFDGVVSVTNAASVDIDNGSDLTLGSIAAPSGSVAVTAEGKLTAGGLIDTSGDEGQAGGAIDLTATGAALNVVNLKANGGEAEGGNAGGKNGGAITLAGNQIALSGAITSTGSRKGNGASAESSGTGGKLILDSNVLLESDVTIDLSSDGGNAGNFELKGTLDSIGTAKGMSIDAGDVTFEGAIGATNALGAVAVISDGAVALGGDMVPDAESITITGQSDHSQSLTATNTSNIWNLLQNADGSGSGESNTLNDVIKFTGFDTVRGGSAGDHFQVQFAEAEFTLIGGSAEGNQLTAFSEGSEWSVLADGFGTLDDNGASTGFSEIQTINGSASDRLQGPDENNTWRLGSAGGGELNTTLDGSEEPTLTLAFTGMDALIGGTSDDDFIMNGGASIGLLRGVTSGEVEAGTNTLLVESESGDTVEWSVARDNSGSVNGVVTDFHDIASLEGGQGADIFTVTNDDGDGKVTIDGGTGDDNTFSFDGVTEAVTLSIGGTDEPWSISNIQVVEGNSHDASELKIAGGTNTWIVNDKNGGTLEQTGAGDDLFSGALTFNDFANLVGGEGADTFEFSANGEVTGSIDGGSTSGNTLSGHDDHSVWTIGVDNGAQEGRIAYADEAVASGDYLASFTSIQSLIGGSGNDRFAYAEGAAMVTTNGGGSEGEETNTLDLSKREKVAITIGSDDLNGVTHIQVLKGNSTDSTLGIVDGVNTWTVNDEAEGVTSVLGSSTQGTIDFSGFTQLDGGTGTDTLVVSSVGTEAVQWQVTGNGVGRVDERLAGFSGMNELQGSEGADTFDLSAGVTTIELDGGLGVNSLQGGNTGNTWLIGVDNTLNGSIEFSNIHRHWGGEDVDHFTLQGGSVPAEVAGGVQPEGASDTLTIQSDEDITVNWTLAGTGEGSVTGRLEGFTGIETLIGAEGNDHFTLTESGSAFQLDGGAGNNELIGFSDNNNPNQWLLTASGGELTNGGATVGFSGINTLTGGDGEGGDRLMGPNASNLWSITRSGGGSVKQNVVGTADPEYSYTFTGMETLEGGTANDRFELTVDGSVETLRGVSEGSKSADDGEDTLLVESDSGSEIAWSISGEGSGSTVSGEVTFEGMDQLEGSEGNDTFTVATDNTITMRLDGGAGNNTLEGANRDNTWVVDASGNSLNNHLNFESIQNLVGHEGDDTFTLDADTSLTSVRGAREGATTTGANELTLQSAGGDSVAWELTGEGDGNVAGRLNEFYDLTDLSGGEGDDTFSVSTPESLTVSLDGGSGNNTIEGANRDNAWVVDAGGNSLNTSLTFEGIHNLVGHGGDDTFTLDADASLTSIRGAREGASATGDNELTLQSADGDQVAWTLTGAGAGTVADRLDNFYDLTDLTGGAGDDTFSVSTPESLTVSLGGGSGNNTIEGANRDNVWVVDAGGNSLNTSLTFEGIQHLVGHEGDDIFTLDADASLTSIRGAREGATTTGANDLTLQSADGESVAWALTGQGEGNVAGRLDDFYDLTDLTGGAGNDTFTVSTIDALALSLDGGTGNNTLEGAQRNNTWVVDAGEGQLNSTLSFEGIQHLVGHETDDTFTLNATASLTSIRGARKGATTMGKNELILHSAGGDSVAWELTGEGEGNVADRLDEFNDLTDLTGGAGDDTFTVSATESLAVSLDGGAGDNTLEGAHRDNTWVVDAGGNSLNTHLTFEGIQHLVGHEGDDTFTLDANASLTRIRGAREGATTTGKNDLTLQSAGGESVAWALTGEGEGNVAGRLDEFYDLTDLTGGAGDDAFTVSATESLTVSLNGGAGDNTLEGANRDNAWVVDAGGNSLNTHLTFEGIQNLVGHEGDDTFTLDANASLTRIRGAREGATTTGKNDLMLQSADGESVAWALTGEGEGNVSGRLGNFYDLTDLTGGEGNDTFTLMTGQNLAVTLDGGAGANTLSAERGADWSWILTGAHKGERNDSLSFDSIQTLIGSTSDTLIGRNQANTWTFDSDAQWSVVGSADGSDDKVIFSGMDELIGNTGADQFNLLADALPRITLDGGSDANNTLNIQNAPALTWSLDSATSGDINDILEFSQIQAFDVSEHTGSSELQGLDEDTRWFLDSQNTVRFGKLGENESTYTSIFGFNTLTGGSGQDHFYVLGIGDLSYTLNGGEGINTLYGAERVNEWKVDVAGTHTLNSSISFSDMNALVGHIESDHFELGVDASIATLRGVQNDPDNFTETGTNTLTVQSDSGVDVNWTVSAADEGTVTDRVTEGFYAIGDLTGGAGDDTFILANGASLSGDVAGGEGANELNARSANNRWMLGEAYAGTLQDADGREIEFTQIETLGGSGSDTLTGRAQPNTWTLNDAGEWSVVNSDGNDDQILFSGMDTLIGNTDADDFSVSAGQNFAGQLDGAGGDNTLVVAGGTNQWTLNETTAYKGVVTSDEEATRVGGFDQIQTLTGSGGDVLTGMKQNNHWRLTAGSAGTVGAEGTDTDDHLIFDGMAKLIGRDREDRFERINSENFQGTVDGGAGSNTLQSAGSNRWLLTGAHKGKLNDDTDFLNIQTLAGGGDNNRLTGSDQESAWRLTGAREGTVQMGEAQSLTFTDMESLTGGEGNDSFTVITGLSREDLSRFETLHGGNGIGDDTLNLTGLNTDEAVAISLGEHGEALAHLKVRGLETLTGHANDDNTLMGASEANTSCQWSIDETDSGSVSSVDDASGETLGELAFSGFANLIGGTRGDVFGIVGDGGITGRIDGGLGEGVNLLDYSDSDGAVDVTLGDALSEGSVSITNINGVVGKNDGLSESAVNSTLSIADGNTDQSTWTIARHSDVPDSDGLNDGLVSNGDDTLYFVNFHVLNGGAGTDEFVFQNSGRLLGTLDGGAGTNTITAQDSTEDLSFSLKASPRADTYLKNIEEVMANTERTNILVAADQGNEWSITGADGSGSLKDHLRFSGFSELVGGTGTDEFVLTGEGRIDHIDGGGSTAGEADTVNLSEVNTPRTVSFDTKADADLTLASIDSVTAQSGAGHQLEGGDRENRWLVDGENSGSLNTQIDFAGFDYLLGNDKDDTFALSGSGIVTGSLSGGDGDDTLDLVELDDGRTLTLALANRDGADLVFGGIETVTAPTLASHTLMASHDANEWKIDGADKGKLNQMSFTGVANLIGGNADDRFEYQPAGSLSGRIAGGDHNGGDVLDASVLNTVEIVLGEAGNVTGVETIIGNNRDTRLQGENLANTWRLTRGENAGTLNGAVSFEGVTDLAGGSEVDTFLLNEGYVTGQLSGGAGDDVFELRLTGRSQGGLDLRGQAGEDQLLMTGGGSGYQAEYTVAGSDEQAMTYTGGANGSVFEVAFSGMHLVQDFTTADQLTLGGTLDADQLTLRDQSYQVNDLGELSYRNKTHLNIAAGSSDRLDIAGSLNVPSTLTIRNAAVTQSDPEARVSARALRLTALESFGSRDQSVHTAVDTLSADIGRGGIFLQDSGALELSDFTTLGESALRAAGDMSAEGAITAGDVLGLQSERGGIRLSGDNQLSGQVNLQAQSDIVINNQRETRLGTVEARSLDLTGSDSLTGGDRLVLEQLQLDIDGDVTLDHSDNAIDELRVSRAGAFNLINGRELTVAELTSRGAASVQANGLTLDGPLSAQAARLDGGNAELVLNGRTEVDQELTGLGQGLELNATLRASDVDLDGGSGALTLNAPVTASAEGRVALSGDQLLAGSDVPLVEAQRLEIRTRSGIGADARLNTNVSELHAANDNGDIRLRNTGELRVERLANNGDIDLVNEGTVQLDGRDGSVFERDNTDAIAAGGTANSNYELGSMVIEVLDGSLQALGQGHADRPDLVGRNATLLVDGNIGTEGRPLVMYIKNSLFMQGLRSLPPTWSFDHRPPSVEDNSSIQVSLQDLLRAGNEQMVEVESLEDINPAIFTEVRNYSFDEVSILMPPDQRYEDDEEERYSRGYSSN